MTTNTDGAMPELPGLALARLFHETYERLAPQFGYTTRPETREFDPESANGKLMIAVCAAMLAAALASQQVPAAADANARADMAKELANMHHDLLVVMQAAWIEWQRGAGANSAMQWIHNTLMGPGLIPDDDEPYASEPQAYFDKNKAAPFPDCFCGRPSNQLWMGKGFCSQAHYAEARALTQPKE